VAIWVREECVDQVREPVEFTVRKSTLDPRSFTIATQPKPMGGLPRVRDPDGAITRRLGPGEVFKVDGWRASGGEMTRQIAEIRQAVIAPEQQRGRSFEAVEHAKEQRHGSDHHCCSGHHARDAEDTLPRNRKSTNLDVSPGERSRN